MIRAAVVGATGFTGEKIVEILASHPEVKLSYLSSRVESPVLYSEYFPRFKKILGDIYLESLNAEKVIESSDVIFLSLPHTVSFEYAPVFLRAGKKVIDMSADYRLKNFMMYEKYYKVKHTDVEHLAQAVYGLPEINRSIIRSSQLIANPGCYPTVTALSLIPIVKSGIFENKIIVDAKSGISGAGRKAKMEYHYSHLDSNIYAYKLFDHQHRPEMVQTLESVSTKDVDLLFTPQVLGFDKGIYITAYVSLTEELSKNQLLDIYRKEYQNEPFVRIFEDKLPQLKDVIDTNFCDIGFDVRGKQLIVCACIDNLMKGAASQAIQNMNIAFGLDEKTGLLINH